jgi:hypothetical protein
VAKNSALAEAIAAAPDAARQLVRRYAPPKSLCVFAVVTTVFLEVPVAVVLWLGLNDGWMGPVGLAFVLLIGCLIAATGVWRWHAQAERRRTYDACYDKAIGRATVLVRTGASATAARNDAELIELNHELVRLQINADVEDVMYEDLGAQASDIDGTSALRRASRVASKTQKGPGGCRGLLLVACLLVQLLADAFVQAFVLRVIDEAGSLAGVEQRVLGVAHHRGQA